MEFIVVGYDGSTAARAALEWVAERARRNAGLVQLVAITNMFLAERPRTEAILDDAQRQLAAAVPGIAVETHVFDGVMPATLLDVSRGTDILVVGVDPGHPIREALHGWKSLRIGARTHVPAFLIPPGWSDHVGPVSVGLDDDESSDAAVDFAADEADRRGVTLRVVHSWSVTGSVDGVPSLREVAHAHRARIGRVLEHVQATHPELTTESHIAHSNPVSALAAAAASSSLIVLGTHHRGILAGGFLGSTTQDLIGVIRTPICIVPPMSSDS